MSIVVPDTSKAQLNWMLWQGALTSISTWHAKVGLYNSNISLSSSTTLANITAHEATFDTYTRQNMTFFLDNGIITGDYDQYLFTPLVWTVGAFGGSDTIYGYFIVGDGPSSSTQLLWCEAAPVPSPMNFVGAAFGVQPAFSLGQI